MHRTPLLIDVSNNNFDEYLDGISRNARKDYRKIMSKNNDLEYSQIEFDHALACDFMQLWEKQTIYGKTVKWGFNVQYLDYLYRKQQLFIFAAKSKSEQNKIISIQFVENFDGYLDCHPPIYDKELYLDRSIAKYMLFKFIEFAINDPQLAWIDFGGGNTGNWKDLLWRQSKKKSKSYKWKFVPKETQKNPHLQKPYIVKTSIFNYKKFLAEDKHKESDFVYRLKRYCVILMYYNRGEILRRLVKYCKARFN